MWAREHVNMQDMLACEDTSTQGTLTREHVNIMIKVRNLKTNSRLQRQLCKKYKSFIHLIGAEALWRGAAFADSLWKLLSSPQNSHTRIFHEMNKTEWKYLNPSSQISLFKTNYRNICFAKSTGTILRLPFFNSVLKTLKLGQFL